MQKTVPEPLRARATIIEGFERTSATLRLTAARHATGFPALGENARARRRRWLAGNAAVSMVARTTAWMGKTMRRRPRVRV